MSSTVRGHYYGKLGMLYPNYGTINSPGVATESMQSVGPTTLGVGNTWTVSVWVKPNNSNPSGDVFSICRTGLVAESKIQFILIASLATRINLWNTAQNLRKTYDYDIMTDTSRWYHWVITWDGTTLTVYLDGVEATPTKTTDLSLTQSDQIRKFSFLSVMDFNILPLTGKLGHFAIWNTVLSENAIAELALPASRGGGYKVNLDAKSNVYNYRNNLMHWYRFDTNSSLAAAGIDYGKATNKHNLTDFSSLTTSNIEKDQP